MTPRLAAAQAEARRLIDRYVSPHTYRQGNAACIAAIVELEDAARECGDPLSNPPVTDVPPSSFVTLPGTENNPDGGVPVLRADLDADGGVPVLRADLDADGGAVLHEVGSAPAEASEPVPTAPEALADALAPYEAPPVPPADKPHKSRNKTK